MILKGKYGTLIQICQNELTNHTLVTVPVLMGSVLAFLQRLAAKLFAAAALKAALALRCNKYPRLIRGGIFYGILVSTYDFFSISVSWPR